VKIAIGSDHIGYGLKLHIIDYIRLKNIVITDFGTHNEERTDYPIYAKKVAEAVVSGEYDAGILVCGTGVGISIAANKVDGIRCVVCSEAYSAKLAREHNNANVLAFGSRVIGTSTAEAIVDAFLTAEYEGGRHQKRIDMITKIERGEM
jgi:ribose 5-phosphate isomerase B